MPPPLRIASLMETIVLEQADEQLGIAWADDLALKAVKPGSVALGARKGQILVDVCGVKVAARADIVAAVKGKRIIVFTFEALPAAVAAAVAGALRDVAQRAAQEREDLRLATLLQAVRDVARGPALQRVEERQAELGGQLGEILADDGAAARACADLRAAGDAAMVATARHAAAAAAHHDEERAAVAEAGEARAAAEDSADRARAAAGEVAVLEHRLARLQQELALARGKQAAADEAERARIARLRDATRRAADAGNAAAREDASAAEQQEAVQRAADASQEIDAARAAAERELGELAAAAAAQRGEWEREWRGWEPADVAEWVRTLRGGRFAAHSAAFADRGVDANALSEMSLAPGLAHFRLESVGIVDDAQRRELLGAIAAIVADAPAPHPRGAAPPPAPRAEAAGGAVPLAEVRVGARVLGRGSLGEVRGGEWRGSQVALKSLHLLSDGAFPLTPAERAVVCGSLEKESALLQRCRHPNVVMFLGLVVHPDSSPAYLMTELVEGGSLYAAIYSDTPLQFPRVLLLLLGAARGVAYLHGEGVTHRDLKPENVLIAPGDVAKIADLGEARQRVFQTFTRGGTHGVGSLLYMAPEMREEEEMRTPKLDVFSLGVTMAEAASRRRPQPGPELRRRVAVPERERRAADIAAVADARLRELVVRCVADGAEERPDAVVAAAELEAMVRAAGAARGGGAGEAGGAAAGDAADDDSLCVVCDAEPRSHAFVPCGHMCLCDGSGVCRGHELDTCPICRGPKGELIRIFN